MARARNIIVVSVTLAMLCAPLVFSLGRKPAFSASENRMRATMPEFPTTLHQLSSFPGRVDAVLRDHLGLREWMTTLYAMTRVRLLRTGNENVLLGQHGWLFYRGENNLEKSAGRYQRDGDIARTAETLEAMQRDLARQGGRLLVAVPPNNATIEVAALPEWARNHGVPTQYDRMLEALRARAIPALDLRPALRASAMQGAAYHRHDTHWTPRGAVAALDAILDWTGAGWRVNPVAVLGLPALKIGGDESKMLGLEEQFSEEVEPLLLPHRPMVEAVDQLPYRETGGRPGGRRILVLGDSFTYSFFAPLLRPEVAELMWMANRTCSFDWSLVLDFHPDEVWWMPTERSITCSPDTRPRNLEVAAVASR